MRMRETIFNKTALLKKISEFAKTNQPKLGVFGQIQIKAGAGNGGNMGGRPNFANKGIGERI
jgi:hypothetical protein